MLYRCLKVGTIINSFWCYNADEGCLVQMGRDVGKIKVIAEL